MSFIWLCWMHSNPWTVTGRSLWWFSCQELSCNIYHAVVLKLKSAVNGSVKVKYVGVFRLWNGFSHISAFTIGILMTSWKTKKTQILFPPKKEWLQNSSIKFLINIFHIWHYRCKIILVQHIRRVNLHQLFYFIRSNWYFLGSGTFKKSAKNRVIVNQKRGD